MTKYKKDSKYLTFFLNGILIFILIFMMVYYGTLKSSSSLNKKNLYNKKHPMTKKDMLKKETIINTCFNKHLTLVSKMTPQQYIDEVNLKHNDSRLAKCSKMKLGKYKSFILADNRTKDFQNKKFLFEKKLYAEYIKILKKMDKLSYTKK